MQNLGQHFLKNKEAIKKIIAALEIKQNDTVIIEIGPGKGALTLPMAENFKFLNPNLKILAVEKDKKLADELKDILKDLKLDNVEIIEGDVLEKLPEIISKLETKKYKLIGNIPYYITGKILRIISELKNKPEISILMIQKEVAERISSVPPRNNLLAAATAIWADVKILFNLKAKEFNPPPKIDSAVIKLTPNNKEISLEKLEKYYKLIHIIFKQPRKTLANNLKNGLGLSKNETEKLIKSVDLPLNARPQDISIEQILKIVI